MKNRFFFSSSSSSSFSSFRFFLLHCASRRFHLSLMSPRNELDSSSSRPLGPSSSSSFLNISGMVLISDFRFVLPFFTMVLYPYICLHACLYVCVGLPPPFDTCIYTRTYTTYIFLISLWPFLMTTPPPRPWRVRFFPSTLHFFNFEKKKKYNNNITTAQRKVVPDSNWFPIDKRRETNNDQRAV